ncbi:IS66 family transposase [Endozoicomonas gorgoniicola]|uniref:IS66 family transposase n=1 Tax=Endozoicomonas gorgoniicola TaxID=1234144 RepID=A0ABT3MTP0_9GAMM|nr:IS66 family transposase [Endozoicomonas gorgoniicola]MCW7552732.1 IS66 family transposase [Endozoicomonas gorgoniicola]
MNHSETANPVDLQLQNRQLQSALDTALQELSSARQQLNWFKRQVFGEKSEKRLTIDNPDQIDLGEIFAKPETTPPPETETITYERRKKQRSDDCVTDEGLRFDERVPVEVTELPAPELQGEDADQYEVIDYKTTRTLVQRPGSYVIHEQRRPVVRHKPSQTLTTVAAPSGIFDRSIADVSLLAGMLIDKFVFHLPLYRQHQRMALSGVKLSRTTLTNLVYRSIELLKPVHSALLKSVLESRILAMDETPGKAGRKEKGKMQKAWFWPVYGERNEVAFTLSLTRSTRHIEPLLKDFKGVLLTDGYGVYDSYCKKHPDITQAQCWVHCRRYFDWAKDDEPEAVAHALALIGKLYRVEKRIRDTDTAGDEKQCIRQEESLPLVDEFFDWCRKERQRPELTKTNPLSKALAYAENHQASLRVFLDDPDVQMDTNHLERLLRCIPMGRKNYLFSWTETGAEHIAIIQSLLVSCRLQDIDPYKYLVDVLQRVSLHPARQINELIPRNWKERFGKNPLKAPLDK